MKCKDEKRFPQSNRCDCTISVQMVLEMQRNEHSHIMQLLKKSEFDCHGNIYKFVLHNETITKKKKPSVMGLW